MHLIVDSSASMDVGTPNKLVYGHQLAMALAYIGLVNQNRVSVGVFGGPEVAGNDGLPGRRRFHQLAPVRGRTSVQRVAAFLIEDLATAERRTHGGGADPDLVFAEAMRSAAVSRAGRGVMVVLSDFLHPQGSVAGLSYLGAATMAGAFDTYCLQLLSPSEIDPTKDQGRGLVGDLRLTDVETGRGAEVTVTPAAIVRYRENLRKHMKELREECLSRGIAYFPVPTDTPIEQLVMGAMRKGGMLR
jgi:uncharacterized protein (DUF58 family)